MEGRNKAPRRPCKKPGCGVLSNSTYCEKHTKVVEEIKKLERRDYDQYRGSASSRGYSYRWSKYAKQFLQEFPLCAACLKVGIVELAQCVDHIKAVSGADDPLFWDKKNHQSLSNKCHSSKTALENGGLGNVKKV